MRLIQHVPKSRAIYGFTSADSRWIYFAANDVKPDSYAVYRYDVAAGKKEVLFSQDGLWEIADYREEAGDTKLLLQKATGALSSEIYEWGTQGRSLKPLLGQGETTEYAVSYAADPSELLVSTNKLGDFRRLYRWKAAGGFTPVTADVKMDVAAFSIDPARKHVYYTLNDGGYTRLRVLDGATLARALPRDEGRRPRPHREGQRDGRYVTVGAETSRAPARTTSTTGRRRA
jgi:hypothetical protein